MDYLSDIRMLSLTSSIVSLVLCFCMIYIFVSRKTYQGFLYWTIASVLYGLGMVLMSLRNVLPDFVSIVVANTCLASGAGIIAYGVNLFLRRPGQNGCFQSLPYLFLSRTAISHFMFPASMRELFLFHLSLSLFMAIADLLFSNIYRKS